jgi:hypothetical protein
MPASSSSLYYHNWLKQIRSVTWAKRTAVEADMRNISTVEADVSRQRKEVRFPLCIPALSGLQYTTTGFLAVVQCLVTISEHRSCFCLNSVSLL